MNMKVSNVFIEDNLYAFISEQARREHTDISNICIKILKEYYKENPREVAAYKNQNRAAKTSGATSFVNLKDFSVENYFKDFPNHSIKMAQEVIDYINEFNLAEPIFCRRTEAAIDFEPNFIRIERLISQGQSYGINISLYGEPYRYKNPPVFLEKGMNSYSRAYIRNYNDLNLVLPLLKETYYLKYHQMLI